MVVSAFPCCTTVRTTSSQFGALNVTVVERELRPVLFERADIFTVPFPDPDVTLGESQLL